MSTLQAIKEELYKTWSNATVDEIIDHLASRNLIAPEAPGECETCQGLGRINCSPDEDGHTHPCDDCQPESLKEFQRGYNAGEYYAATPTQPETVPDRAVDYWNSDTSGTMEKVKAANRSATLEAFKVIIDGNLDTYNQHKYTKEIAEVKAALTTPDTAEVERLDVLMSHPNDPLKRFTWIGDNQNGEQVWQGRLTRKEIDALKGLRAENERLKGNLNACVKMAQGRCACRFDDDENLKTECKYHGELRAQIDRLAVIARELLDDGGWRGSGPKSDTHFYCEYCKAESEDSSVEGMGHLSSCLIIRTREALREYDSLQPGSKGA